MSRCLQDKALVCSLTVFALTKLMFELLSFEEGLHHSVGFSPFLCDEGQEQKSALRWLLF